MSDASLVPSDWLLLALAATTEIPIDSILRDASCFPHLPPYLLVCTVVQENCCFNPCQLRLELSPDIVWLAPQETAVV